jgi:tetratricopeptide (TPR) repeat protein
MQIRPDDAQLANNLGEALRRQQRWAEAIGWFQCASRMAPDFAEPQYNLGITLRAQGQTAEALEAFRRAVDLRPDYVRAHLNLGLALEERGELDAALDAYRQALHYSPQFAAARAKLGQVLARSGRDVEALEQHPGPPAGPSAGRRVSNIPGFHDPLADGVLWQLSNSTASRAAWCVASPGHRHAHRCGAFNRFGVRLQRQPVRGQPAGQFRGDRVRHG